MCHRLQVHFQSGHEHQKQNAQMRQMAEGFFQMRVTEHRPMQHVEHRGTQNQAGQ